MSSRKFRVRTRWAHWAFGAGAIVLSLYFGYIITRGLVDPRSYGQGVRIFIPPYVLCCYWTLATALNVRTVLVTATSVRVKIRPFPVGTGYHIDRSEISRCYTRRIVVTQDDVVLGRLVTAGIETCQGVQIDLSGPYESEEAATAGAAEFTHVLNSEPGSTPIPLYPGLCAAPDITRKGRTILWGAAFVLAILVGGAWVAAHERGVQYIGPRFW
jgi:hypothetical protein